GNGLVGGAVPQRLAQIETVLAIQAEEPGSVRGKAAAVASSAERSRGRGNDAEYGSVSQRKPLGRCPIRLTQGLDGAVTAAQGRQDLALAYPLITRPLGRATAIHVFDKTHLCGLAPPELDQSGQLVVIVAPDDHHVELNGS